jgi:guanylate kinase
MSNKGKLFVVSAPSGTGKSTVIDAVMQELPTLKKPISYTTRPPRPGEVNGIDYNFVDISEFENMKNEKKLLEWATVYGNYYGTSLETVNNALSSGTFLLKDIDTQGALQLKSKLGKDAVLIFINPPSIQVLETRIRQRASDSEQQIKTRMDNAKKEMSESPKYDHVIINDELKKAVNGLKKIISGYMTV